MKGLVITKKDETSSEYTSYESSYDYSTSIPYESSIDPDIDDDSQNDYTETDIYETDSEYPDDTTKNETKRITLNKGNKRGNMTGLKSINTLKNNNTIPVVQNKLTNKEILKRLEGCISLNSIEEMEILKTLPTMKTWIRYMNKHTKLFRLGGLLMKVNYPDYIVLVNTVKKIVWSVQLKDNIIFIKDTSETDKANKIKEKLFKLYNSGRLLLKDE